MGIKETTKKRVCILGAGAAGLCAARHCLDEGYDVTIFEQQKCLGGTWLYSPEVNAFSSLYEKMHTNLPKQIMGFEHLPFETDGPESFVRHQEVLAYLKRYAKSIYEFIHFNTVVTKIKHEGSEWKVTVKPVALQLSLSNGNINGVLNGQITRTETFIFDALFICNGHFSQPRVPIFAEKLKLPWIHCHNYRRPHVYKGKEVAIVGAGPSGVDVAIQVSKFAKKVHMLHNQKLKFGLPENVVDNSRLIGVDEDGQTLLLENGEKLKGIDYVIFCTGYLYEIPFCEKDLVETREDGRYLSNLYLHCVSTQHPRSLFFIGLCWNLIPFVCFDHQVNYALSILNGTAQVPSQKEMEQFEKDRLNYLKENNLPVGFFHRLAGSQWDYFNLLAKLSNHQPLRPVIQKIYDHVHDQRSLHLATFKSFRYKILNSEEFSFEPMIDLDCN